MPIWQAAAYIAIFCVSVILGQVAFYRFNARKRKAR